jgi:hypothetical protein
MNVAPDDLLDAFAREAVESLPGVDGLGLVAGSLAGIPPRPALRERLLAGVAHRGRFARFGPAVARILDVAEDHALRILDRLDDPAAWSTDIPGLEALWVEGGPRVQGAVRGFLRIPAGIVFAEHEHLGAEHTLVLQGACTDVTTGALLRPGDEDRMPAGSRHAFATRAGGADFVQLAVAQTGYRLGDLVVGPR